MTYTCITSIPTKELLYTKILFRASLNVPIKNNIITEKYRIQSNFESIRYLLPYTKKIIILAHNGKDGSQTLEPFVSYFSSLAPTVFAKDFSAVERLLQSDCKIVLLENIRSYKEETMPSYTFAQHLASYGDIYVNEAFDVCHRDDTSVSILPQLLPSYAGIRLDSEIQHLTHARTPNHPSVAFLGGAKPQTKLPLLRRFLEQVDTVFVGGVLLNHILKEKGCFVGTSYIDTSCTESLFDIASHPRLILPQTVLVQNKNGNIRETSIHDIEEDECIKDVGKKSIQSMNLYIQNAQEIIWNGPFGVYEEGFTSSTEQLVSLLKNISAETIVGGGDTLVEIERQNAFSHFTFVSIGGGAMLEFLEKGTLLGIDALKTI